MTDLAKIMRGSSEEALREHHRQLAKARERASTALKRNVHDNYSQFIRTSREVNGAHAGPKCAPALARLTVPRRLALAGSVDAGQ